MPKAITLRAKQPMRNEMTRHDTPLTGLRATRPEHSTDGAKHFAQGVRCKMLARLTSRQPDQCAEMLGAPQIVKDWLKRKDLEALTTKANVNAGTTSDSTWGGGLVGEDQLAGAFQVFMRRSSVIDRVWADATKVGLNTYGALMTAGASGAEVSEGSGKPLQQLSFTEISFSPTKVSAALAMTEELVRGSGAVAQIQTEMRNAVRDASDTAFLADLIALAYVGNSQGNDDYASIAQDIRELLNAVDWGDGSSLYLVCKPRQAAHLSSLAFAGGHTMPPTGGTFMGIPVVVTTNLPDDRLMLVNASSLVMAMTDIEVRVSRQADMNMADSTSQSSASVAGTNMVSAFQTNSVFAICERSFGVMQGNRKSVAVLDNAVFGNADSPQNYT
jgi:HK97 family phage major capsid protein